MTRWTYGDPYEPYLRRQLLAQGWAVVADLSGPGTAEEGVLDHLLELLVQTQVKALGDAAGAALAAALPTGGGVRIRVGVFAAVAVGAPLWRFRALSGDATIQEALLTQLADSDAHVRTAAIQALAPRCGRPGGAGRNPNAPNGPAPPGAQHRGPSLADGADGPRSL